MLLLVAARARARRADRCLTFCSHEYSSAPLKLQPVMCKEKGRADNGENTPQSEADSTRPDQMTDKHLIFFYNEDPPVDQTPFNMQNTHNAA